jgi:hypothetical protein
MLKAYGKLDDLDFDYQLKTNNGLVYTISNGKVVFLPNHLRGPGLLFENRDCFDEMIASDRLPIDNPGNSLYDTELERIRTINKQIDFYRGHLNTVLKFDFPEISEDVAQAYLKKVIGRTIKKLTTNTDLVGLIAVFGEVMRRKIDGKWVIEKWYGSYNPYYMPRILNPQKKLIHIDSLVLGNVKWKVSSVDTIFRNIEGYSDLDFTRRYHECTILED